LAFAGTLNLLTHFTNHFITCHCIYHSSHLHVRQLLFLLFLVSVYVGPRGVSTTYRTQTNVGRAGDLPNPRQIWNKCIYNWRRVEVSCFSTITADAINTAKPSRAACDLLARHINEITRYAKNIYIRRDKMRWGSNLIWYKYCSRLISLCYEIVSCRIGALPENFPRRRVTNVLFANGIIVFMWTLTL